MSTFWRIFNEFIFVLQLLVAELLFVGGQTHRKHFYWKIFSLIIVAVLFFVVIPSEFFVTEIIKYIIGFGLMFLLVFLCYDLPIGYSLFVAMVAYAMQHLLYCAFDLLRSVYDVSGKLVSLFVPAAADDLAAYMNYYCAFHFLLTTLFFIAGYTAMYFIFIRKLRAEKSYEVGSAGQLALLGLILLTTMMINLLCRRYAEDIPLVAMVSVRLLAMLSCIFSMVAQMRTFERDKTAKTNMILDHLLHEEAKRHEISKENIDLINIKCHDLKKQINTLRRIVSDEEKEKNIAEIERAIMIYDSIAKTGNDSLDVVLTEKSLLCDKESIKVNYIADGKILNFIDTGDIYTLFSNALDNAIESVRQIGDSEKRFINIYVQKIGNMADIVILNCFEGTIKLVDGLPKTSNDAKFHGFGVLSIKRIVEKYRGNMVIKTEHDCFEVKIVIPLQGDAGNE